MLNATDLTWAGGEVGNNSGFNFSDFGNWSPMGNTPSSFDNVTIGNFTATTDGSTDQYKINGFTQVNDLRIENLVLPKGEAENGVAPTYVVVRLEWILL